MVEGEEQSGLLDEKGKNERREFKKTTPLHFGKTLLSRSWFHRDAFRCSTDSRLQKFYSETRPIRVNE